MYSSNQSRCSVSRFVSVPASESNPSFPDNRECVCYRQRLRHSLSHVSFAIDLHPGYTDTFSERLDVFNRTCCSTTISSITAGHSIRRDRASSKQERGTNCALVSSLHSWGWQMLGRMGEAGRHHRTRCEKTRIFSSS